MGKASKIKGSTFERRVAGEILKAAGKGFDKKDCYRTPMSGGHPYTGDSDLVISKRLRRFFPFIVECKHRKTWKLEQMFTMPKSFVEFVDQVNAAARKDKLKRAPLIVIRSNGGKTYAAYPSALIYAWSKRLATSTPGFIWVDSKTHQVWKLVLLSAMLKKLTVKVKNRRLI